MHRRYGKDYDSTIFKRSTLWTSIHTNILELTSKRPLSETEGPNVPYFFVRDNVFKKRAKLDEESTVY
jgi:hypothetical protein